MLAQNKAWLKSGKLNANKAASLHLDIRKHHPQVLEFDTEADFLEAYPRILNAFIQWGDIPKTVEKITETREPVAFPAGENPPPSRAELIAEVERLSKMLKA